MSFSRRRNALPFASLLVLATAVTVPATLTIMTQAAGAQSLAAGLLPAAALPAAAAAITPRLAAADVSALPAGDDDFSTTGVDTGTPPARVTALADDMVCIAKVIVHEARNQPRAGQLAVAQLILARAASGRFPASACGVVNQHGQFFDTSTYEPDRAGAAWAAAVAVTREAIEGAANPVAPGALFYHAAYQAPTSFFRTRQRVAMLGDHIFYR